MLRVLFSVLLAHPLMSPISSNARSVRLVNGTNSCSGRVEILHNGVWGTVCDEGWDLKDAEVVCKQLGCGKALSAPHAACFGRGSEQIWLDNVNCSESESSLSECVHPGSGINNCTHNKYAGVVCEVDLTWLSISVMASEDGEVLCPPNPQRSEVNMGSQSLEVTRGHNFSISCSTESQYPGGSFQLLFSGSNEIRTQPALGPSACFLFPEADYPHQGNYSCVYQVTVASCTFTSGQTEPATVTVKVSWVLPVLIAASGLVLLFILLLGILLVWRCRCGKRQRTLSLHEARSPDAMKPDGRERYGRNEPEEDDERDYEFLDDEDKDDYVNTETLGGKRDSVEEDEEEDYVNTETLEGKRDSSGEEEDYVTTETLEEDEEEDYVNTETLEEDEEEDYVNTEVLGKGLKDYECMEKCSAHSDGEDYVNIDPLGAGMC